MPLLRFFQAKLVLKRLVSKTWLLRIWVGSVKDCVPTKSTSVPAGAGVLAESVPVLVVTSIVKVVPVGTGTKTPTGLLAERPKLAWLFDVLTDSA